jgi:ribosomal protein L40E
MSDETIICRRCGARNPAGDQFCGSCGAFLEWEGTTAPEEPVTGPEAGPIERDPQPPIAVPVIDRPPPDPAPPIAPVTAGFAVCPTCGSGNPPGRTFCHNCGNLLAREPSTGTSRPSPTHGEEPRRGLPGWLPLMLGAGLVVGVVVVLVTVVFKPSTPPSTAAASATLTPTLEVPPSVTAPPGSGGSSGLLPSGVAPSAPPGGAVQLTLSGATASASAPDAPAGLAIDGSLDTCWTIPPDGPEQWIDVTFAVSRLDYLVVYSGCQSSHESFVATSRPQNVTVSVNGAGPAGYVLADSELPQRIDVTDTPGATEVRVQILSKFIGATDAATSISEIRAFGVPGG